MYLLWIYSLFQLSFSPIHCQLQLKLNGTRIRNNSYISYTDVTVGGCPLECWIKSTNTSEHLTWRYEGQMIVQQEADGDGCLNVTRINGSICISRRRNCIPPTSGLWRCNNASESSEIFHSLYFYIGNGSTYGSLNESVLISFVLHTEPRVNPPEFTITCQTHGGPAEEVQWFLNVTASSVANQSQIIISAADDSVYDNKIHVRGRVSGTCKCIISNQFPSALEAHETITVAGEPTNLTAMVIISNSTHVNIIMLWTAPPDPVTGYVIYYQSQRGPVLNETVTGRGETHSLDGLQKGATYNISIVALSQHLPSLLVGPVTVSAGLLLIVETESSINTTLTLPFSLTCIVRAKLDAKPLNTTIEWIRILSTSNVTSDMEETLIFHDCSPNPQNLSSVESSSECEYVLGSEADFSTSVFGYQSVLHRTENGTDTTVIYRCQASTQNTTSFSDITVYVEDPVEYSSIDFRRNTLSPTTIPSLSIFSGSPNLNHSTIMKTVLSSIALSTTTISITTSGISVNSTISTSMSSIDGKVTHPTISEPIPSSDIYWILATSGVTVCLILFIIFSFIFFIFCFKRTDKTNHETLELKRPVRLQQDDESICSERQTELAEEGLNNVLPRSDIPVNEFPDYVRRVAEEYGDSGSKLADEYFHLKHTCAETYHVASLPHNVDFNRFRNIYPYDNSRVILTELPDKPGSEYINASFISGCHGNNFIAAQAPLKETIDHFWRMIWEYGVKAIVMLTKCIELSKEKCAQYWPETLNETVTPGDRISVTLLTSTPYAEYSIRKFEVKHLEEKGESVTVTQFHYTAWPDHGVPDNVMAVIGFIRHVRKLFPTSPDPPLLVHCSAGVGRTGTFITLDMMMQQMTSEGTLSVCQCVKHLRTQRMKMVQTLAQYEFIHYALSELVVCGETEIAAANLRSFTDSLRDLAEGSGPTISQQHMTTLNYLCTQQKFDFTGGESEANVNKNRFPNKLPNEIYRVPLRSDGGFESEYINASFVNGYKQKNAYIATQGPLKETVDDFWKMVWDYQCGCIVMLCQLEEDGQENSYCYWPEDEGQEIVSGRLRVRLMRVRGHGDIMERKLEVTECDSVSTNPLNIRMIQLTSWPLQGLPHPSAIMSLIEKINRVLMRSSSKQTVVMCSDGVVRSGTFLCIHSQLERLKTEGVVDVFQAIRSARIQRPGVIPNIDHYIFCYEVLADYVEKMEAYHNFKTLM